MQGLVQTPQVKTKTKPDSRVEKPPSFPVLGVRPADGAEGDVDLGRGLQGGRAGQQDEVGPGERRAELLLDWIQQGQAGLEVGVD